MVMSCKWTFSSLTMVLQPITFLCSCVRRNVGPWGNRHGKADRMDGGLELMESNRIKAFKITSMEAKPWLCMDRWGLLVVKKP